MAAARAAGGVEAMRTAGLTYVRGCEVIEIRDEGEKVFYFSSFCFLFSLFGCFLVALSDRVFCLAASVEREWKTVPICLH